MTLYIETAVKLATDVRLTNRNKQAIISNRHLVNEWPCAWTTHSLRIATEQAYQDIQTTSFTRKTLLKYKTMA